jgi:tetratricopeptide (TPR) repeat protein
MIAVFLCASAAAQTGGDVLRLPSRPGSYDNSATPAPAGGGLIMPGKPQNDTDPAGARSGQAASYPSGLYADAHQAAVGALQFGNTAWNTGHNMQRARTLTMIAVERDPSWAVALFNLGIMATVDERWDDALDFYREAARLDSSSALKAFLTPEFTRVSAIKRADAAGKGARRYALDLSILIPKLADPATAIDGATKLTKADAGRWEGFAALGIAQAGLAQYAASAASFEAAGRMAPEDWRGKLNSAVEIVTREAQYNKLVQDADVSRNNKQYDAAGKLYADAWQTSPARTATGMQAAVCFLMADQVPLAVQTLARLRQLKDPAISEKATAMLKELAAISPDAASAGDAGDSSDVEAIFDVGQKVRTLIGELRGPQIRLMTQAAPALMSEDLKAGQLTSRDDELNNPKLDMRFISTESQYAIYLKEVGGRRISEADRPPVQDPVDTASAANSVSAAPVSPGMFTPPKPYERRPAMPAAESTQPDGKAPGASDSH